MCTKTTKQNGVKFSTHRVLLSGVSELAYEWGSKTKTGGQRTWILTKNLYFEAILVKFQQKWVGSFPPAPLYPTPLTLIDQKQKVIFFSWCLTFWLIFDKLFQFSRTWITCFFFIFLWITMIQFISLSFVLPRKVKKIKVSLLCSYIKCIELCI